MNKRMHLLTILIVFYFSAFGQIKLDVYSPKDMNKDLEILLEIIEAHPDPYAKISEIEFQELVDSVKQNISEELDEIEFYKNMSTIVASIGDGHSSVYMKKNWVRNTRKEYGVFPYEVYLTNEGDLYVISTYGDTSLTIGAQIIAINGMEITDFVDLISPYISYETIPYRNDIISRSFELMLYLVFKQVDQLRFKIREIEVTEVTVKTMDYKLWKKEKKDLREDREKKIARGKPYDYEIIKPGVAKIDIFSFAVRDIRNYNIFLGKTFKDMRDKRVHSLIIDVRGNYGGWPKVASELFHYIHNGYFKTIAKSSMKISYPYRKYFTDRSSTLRKSNDIVFQERRHFVDLHEVIYGEINTYDDDDQYFNETPFTEDYEFYGDCFLLIDRKSFSAASSFAATFQCYNMGILVGEPTGGTKIFRANAFSETLHKSNFWVRMSTTKLYSTCYNEEDEPVTPNFEVVPSILDRVHEVDSQLNVSLRIIDKLQLEKAEAEK